MPFSHNYHFCGDKSKNLLLAIFRKLKSHWVITLCLLDKRGWLRWHVPIIPSTWDAEIGGLQLKACWGKKPSRLDLENKLGREAQLFRRWRLWGSQSKTGHRPYLKSNLDKMAYCRDSRSRLLAQPAWGPDFKPQCQKTKKDTQYWREHRREGNIGVVC